MQSMHMQAHALPTLFFHHPHHHPNTLQLKQRQGGHDLASVLMPMPSVDGLSLHGFELGPKGQLLLSEDPLGGVSHFYFELMKAMHVGPTGGFLNVVQCGQRCYGLEYCNDAGR